MTTNNIQLAGVIPMPNGTATTRNADQSHQGWLRELERAQAGLVKPEQTRTPQNSFAKHDEDSSADEKASKATVTMSAPSIGTHAWQPGLREQQTFASQKTITSAALLSHEVVASQNSFYGVSTVPGVANRNTAAIRAPQAGDMLPGREKQEQSAASFKLLKSGEQVVDAVVRDSSMTLESELKLAQQVRSVVREAGARLGKFWLNGRTISNDSLGDKNGD